jgi:hypothetical protein
LALKEAARAVKAALEGLDRDLAEAARGLSLLDLKSDEARAVIGRLQAGRTDVVIDACTISPDGVMLLVAPDAYRSFEGKDISDQPQVRRLFRTQRPVMSDVFRTVEGVAAIDLEHPVMGPNGECTGSVSIIFQPWVLIERCVGDRVAGLPVEIWAMQPDGMIIYDADSQEVGKMLFTDPEYRPFPELLELGKRIAAEPEGQGAYSYFKAGTSQVVYKEAWWVSVGLHGMVWRLVSVHPSQRTGAAPNAKGGPFSTDALRVLARDPALIQAISRGDEERAMACLQEAAETHSGIYSLSFVDADAVNRFGYPRENSLFQVDLRQQSDPASIAMVGAVKDRVELAYTGPLVEGGSARYSLTPVWEGRRYLGALLWIQK